MTLLSLLAAVAQLNSAFYHITACMRMRKDIIQRSATVPVFSCYQPDTDGDNFMNRVVVPEEWREIFACWFRLALTDLNEKVSLHVEGTTAMRALMDVFYKGDLHIV